MKDRIMKGQSAVSVTEKKLDLSDSLMGFVERMCLPDDYAIRAQLLTVVAIISQDSEKLHSAFVWIRSHITCQLLVAQCTSLLVKRLAEIGQFPLARKCAEEIAVLHVDYKIQAYGAIVKHSRSRADRAEVDALIQALEESDQPPDNELAIQAQRDIELMLTGHHRAGFCHFEECASLNNTLAEMYSEKRRTNVLALRDRVEQYLKTIFAKVRSAI